jgi:hypothetical protein
MVVSVVAAVGARTLLVARSKSDLEAYGVRGSSRRPPSFATTNAPEVKIVHQL